MLYLYGNEARLLGRLRLKYAEYLSACVYPSRKRTGFVFASSRPLYCNVHISLSVSQVWIMSCIYCCFDDALNFWYLQVYDKGIRHVTVKPSPPQVSSAYVKKEKNEESWRTTVTKQSAQETERSSNNSWVFHSLCPNHFCISHTHTMQAFSSLGIRKFWPLGLGVG